MSREFRDLLHGIVDKEALIRAWTVEVSPAGSALRAQTRRAFQRREDALAAAHTLLEELVRSSHREVRAAVPGTTAHVAGERGKEWRGVVDVHLAPL